MKLGLLARAEDRGIGIQTWEFHRHMHPERTLVVDMGPLARGFEPHLDRYPGATVVPFRGGQLPEHLVRPWLEGLDVVYMVETPYDHRLLTWAAEGDTATVVHVNPEFFRWATEPLLARPTVWWAPSTWRKDQMPAEVEYVPQAVATDRWPVARHENAELHDDRPVFVHVAGHQAVADRNGTRQLLMALRYLTAPLRLRLLGQDRRMPSRAPTSRHVTVESHLGGLRDYWRLYEDADVLVLPRRYGGLCLPALEAMGAGLAVVMSDAEPQRTDWPVVTVETRRSSTISTQGGPVTLVDTVPRLLAAAIDQLAMEPAVRMVYQVAGRTYALRHSWDRLAPDYRARLAEAVERVR